MLNEIIKIAEVILKSFAHIWPYLVLTIPMAVAVNMSGVSKYIKRAFEAGPTTSILLATLVGAFSPFCSCGVIPVIASLLIGGVPLAPVMSFWIASPSMDPEIFFLSVGTLGWNLAVWRLGSTLVLSLAAGFLTHFFVRRQWIGTDIMKKNTHSNDTPHSLIPLSWPILMNRFKEIFTVQETILSPAVATYCGQETAQFENKGSACGSSSCAPSDSPSKNSSTQGCKSREVPFKQRLIKESLAASLMVVKFMALAFFLEALIILYVPEDLIVSLMGETNSWAILTAAFLGIPIYTSNLSALPMVSGLLAQGMSPAAALAFLIAGPTTTLPAIAAVWTLVNRRVFILYVSYALLGAILFGYLNWLFS